MADISTLFYHFYFRPRVPYPITHLNAFGRIHNDRQPAVVADEIRFAANSDKSIHFRRVRIDRHQGASYRPQLADFVAWKSPAFYRFLLDIAAEEVGVPFVNLDCFSDDQFYLLKR
jgi:hypothetical protein